MHSDETVLGVSIHADLGACADSHLEFPIYNAGVGGSCNDVLLCPSDAFRVLRILWITVSYWLRCNDNDTISGDGDVDQVSSHPIQADILVTCGKGIIASFHYHYAQMGVFCTVRVVAC